MLALGTEVSTEKEPPRHVQALIAVLDVHSGKTLAACGRTRAQVDLPALMQKVAKAYPHQLGLWNRSGAVPVLRIVINLHNWSFERLRFCPAPFQVPS